MEPPPPNVYPARPATPQAALAAPGERLLADPLTVARLVDNLGAVHDFGRGWATLAGLLVSGVAACVAPRFAHGVEFAPRTADEVRAGVEREFDPYRRIEVLRGPEVIVGDDVRWRLARRTPQQAAAEYSLELEWRGAEWKFFENAYELGGRRLELRSGGRDVLESARVRERVLVQLPRELLDEPRDGPLQLRVFGAKGDLDLSLPRFYLRGFLGACEATSAGETAVGASKR